MADGADAEGLLADGIGGGGGVDVSGTGAGGAGVGVSGTGADGRDVGTSG